jgi:nicotinamidase-related amidase/type 1 glutamine amidotransferase
MLAKTIFLPIVLLVCGAAMLRPGYAQTLDLQLRYQEPTQSGSARFHRLTKPESWATKDVAVIVCDMWDSHHCVNAVRRVQEVAPRIDQFVAKLRAQGATIIHAPSSCMEPYKDHPARLRAQNTAAAKEYPDKIESWCDQIPAEQQANYPLDQSEGGEDDDLEEHQRWAEQLASQGRNPRSPWKSQISVININGDQDFITDSGNEVWNILQSRGIKSVMLVGVHTNMCVLGRPFGLRRLAAAGKNVVLVRDLTDTMYDPRAWPYANHFTGTDLIVSHIERYVCPTISSNQILGDSEFRFAKDLRPQLTMVIAEDEYRTEESLPAFAAKHLSQHFRVTYAYGSDTERNRVLSLEDVKDADALLVSVRRRPLPAADIEVIRQFVRSGKPMIGIRTASHPFSIRTGKLEEGLVQWPEFDREVWGGNYTNHYGNDLKAELSVVESEVAKTSAILNSLGKTFELKSGGSLYKAGPLGKGATTLLMGKVEGKEPEPIAWTYVRSDGGRSFYTSLGHVDDFAQPQFEALLSAGIHWACEQPIADLESIKLQNSRYAAGKGRQRK